MLKSAVDHIIDCASHWLGISRARAAKLLLEHADDELVRALMAHEIAVKLLLEYTDVDEVRALMAPEIAEAFVESSLPLEVKTLDELAAFVADLNDKKASYDEEFYRRLMTACTSEAVFVAFVKAEVANPDAVLGLLLPFDGEDRTSSIDAIAYLLKMNVKIWAHEALYEDNGVLVVSEAHVYVHDKKRPWLHMLHTDYRTHFERLHQVPKGSKTYEVGQSWVAEVREQNVNLDKSKLSEEEEGADQDGDSQLDPEVQESMKKFEKVTDEENCKDDNGGRSKHVHEHGDQNGAD